jgi:ribosomal protein S18 acetylase RimI-like enzyme
MMDNHVMRRASVDDLNLLRSISIQTFRETFLRHNTLDNIDRYVADNLSEEKLFDEFTNSESQFFISFYNHEPSGYLKVNTGSAQTEFSGSQGIEIERIYVLQQYQGKGIGAMLLKHAVDIASNKHFESIWLGVWEHNKNAIGFYSRYGFSQVSEHAFFVGDDRQTDIIMKADVYALCSKLHK